MNVIVGSGAAKADYYVVAGNIAGQGNYMVRLEAATVTVTLNAADGSLARKDEIYLVVLDDAYDSTTLALPRLAYRDGTPAASPTAPGPDAAWDAYVLIATIDVPAAASDILACTITDERLASTIAHGQFASDTSASPNAVGPNIAPQEGTAKTFSRTDHVHLIGTGTPGTIEPDDSASPGISTSVAAADHQHAIATAAPVQQTPDQSNAEGTATSFARSDHVHNIPAGAPTGSLTPDEANSEGSAASFARSDHQHNIPAAAAGNIGTANSEGSAASFARSDHVHRIVDAGAVAVKAGQDAFNSSTATTTSFVDTAGSISFTMPSGWNTATIVAWGTVHFDSVNTNGVMEVRVEIGASNGSTTQSNTSQTPVTLGASHAAVVSGTSTVTIAAKHQLASGIIRSGFVAYIAYRSS
jgi:hypothetical protein